MVVDDDQLKRIRLLTRAVPCVGLFTQTLTPQAPAALYSSPLPVEQFPRPQNVRRIAGLRYRAVRDAGILEIQGVE